MIHVQKKVSEATRQNIIDLISIGFQDSGIVEEIAFHWSGRMEEPDFLNRLYNLHSMGSTDFRFSNAYDDIYKHRVLNFDGDSDWVFSDSRFNLKYGDDANLLEFLSEMFHPVVRNEKHNWKKMLMLINKILLIDGFELYEKLYLSNKAVYGWRRVYNQNIIINDLLDDIIRKFDSDYLRSQITLMNGAIDINPYEAIGKAKELLETCCKTILRKKNVPVGKKWDVMKLTNETCGVLKLTPNNIDNDVMASITIKNLLQNLSIISQSVAELRNSYGSGHGKDARFKGLSPRHARLAVGASVTLVHFLFETFEEKHSGN